MPFKKYKKKIGELKSTSKSSRHPLKGNQLKNILKNSANSYKSPSSPSVTTGHFNLGILF